MMMNEPSFNEPFAPEPEPDSDSSTTGTSRSSVSNQGKQQPFMVFSSFQTIITYAFLLATLFTLFTPNNLFSGQMLTKVFQAWQANPTNVAPVNNVVPNPELNHIGIVSGHWKNDAGAVCPNGLTEEQVNLTIASLVQQQLTAEGFQVDLLEEFDPRLSQYKAIALLSIHNDTCEYINDSATGFKVAAAFHSTAPEKANRLTACMVDRYATRTGLTYLTNATNDMTYYHAFDEIDPETTAAIIEAGFLNLDQQILTQKPELIAQGIVDGLLCFIRNESIAPTPTNP